MRWINPAHTDTMNRSEYTANEALSAATMQGAQAFWCAASTCNRTVVRRSWFARLFNL